MASRGRGRGGRFGGRNWPHADNFQFELFPGIEYLSDVRKLKEEPNFYSSTLRLQKLWNSSPYYYKGVDHVTEGCENVDVERYSANDSAKISHTSLLSDYIKMTDEYVPAELAVRNPHLKKRVRWNQELDMQKLDIFEQLEKKCETAKDKKEGEAEEDDDERTEEEDEEYSDDGDYNQTVDFDDDDFNMADENDDEPNF